MSRYSYFDLRTQTLFHCKKPQAKPLPKHLLEVQHEDVGPLRRSNAGMGASSAKHYFSSTRHSLTWGTPDLSHHTNKDLIAVEQEFEEVDASASTPSAR